MEKFTFFWNGPFSQWKFSKFSDKNNTYNCAEQYMMYNKALYFNDLEIAQRIIEEKNPREQKALGRKVKNFNAEEWDKVARDIVREGSKLKYTQNEKLKELLLATKGTTLVEASPYDKIWGIGLKEDNLKALNRDTWYGKNWLGEVLTSVREEIEEEND